MSTRGEVLGAMRALQRGGLVQGSSGNASIRADDGIWITATGVRPEEMTEEDVIKVDPDGEYEGPGRPSTEWRMHLEVYRARPEVGGVVHTHSPHATAVSCLRRDIPAFHYMIGVAGGDSIRCAPYATVASAELAEAAVEALLDRSACLLANHGTLALGSDVAAAVHMAEEVEHLARVYCIARQTGDPVLLDHGEMAEVMEAFRRYRTESSTES